MGRRSLSKHVWQRTAMRVGAIACALVAFVPAASAAAADGVVINIIRDYPAGWAGWASPVAERVLWVNAASPVAGDGSAALPFRTIEAGLHAARAGDTVIVKGGTYREQITFTSPAPGTAERPITIRAADGERPWLVGHLSLKFLEHWIFDGINVTWDVHNNDPDDHMVKFESGTSWVFRNAEVSASRSASAVFISGNPVDWRLTGLYVHDTQSTNGLYQDHLIYVSSGSGGGLIDRNLLVRSSNGRAIKIGTVGNTSPDIGNIVVSYNTMVDNLGPSSVRLSYRVSNITLHNNLMVGAAPRYENITVYNLAGDLSTAYDNWGWASDGVVEDHPHLTDGGGNVYGDPRLDANFRPTNPAAVPYGHLAP